MAEPAQAEAKKVLWVLSSFAVGAPQRRIAALINGMSRASGRRRYEHAVFALNGDYAATALIEPGVTWRRLDEGAAVKKKIGGGFLISKLWTSRRILAAERPDLLVTSGLGAVEWLAVNRGPGAAPHLHFQDAVGAAETLEGADGKGDWARRRAFPAKERLFIATGGESASLLADRWGVDREAIRDLPWGVDLDLVRPRERSGDGVVFGSLSPLVAEKRHDRSLRILASLRERGRNASLRLVGQGPERRRLEALAESLGLAEHLQIVDRDGLDPQVAAEETARMDVYVDLGDQGRVAAAPALALAAGLPFLASDLSAAQALATRENGLFLRSTQDESALAAAAELLCADEDLRRGVGASNRSAAEAHHGVDAMLDQFESVIEELFRADRLALPAPGAQVANRETALDLKPTPLKPTPLKPTPMRPTALKPTELKPTPLAPTALKPFFGDRLNDAATASTQTAASAKKRSSEKDRSASA